MIAAAGVHIVSLREDQIQRYARHVLLPDVGGRGQERLLAAEVEVELGPGRDAELAALAYLAAAGVGRIAIAGAGAAGPIEAGEVTAGILYGAGDVGRPRIEAVAERIGRINPDVRVAAGAASAAGWRLADELAPAGEPGASTGAAAGAAGDGMRLADALVRGGAAATRVLTAIARRP